MTVLGLGCPRCAARSGAAGFGGGGACSRGGGTARAAGEGRADVANLDIREDNRRACVIRLEVLGVPGSSRTCAACSAEARRGGRVCRVEPEHVRDVVIPDAERQDHAVAETSLHTLHAALRREAVRVSEDLLLVRAVLGRDRIVGGEPGNVSLRVLVDLAVLDVNATDLGERAGGGSVRGDELCDDGHLLLSVEGGAGAKEGFVTHAIGIDSRSAGYSLNSWAVFCPGLSSLRNLTLPLLSRTYTRS